MKKLFIVLAAIIVIRLGSIAYLETQQLEKPIILAQDIHFDSDMLYISYITNRAQPHEISNVVINDHHFYPYQETDFFGFHTNSNTNQSTVYANGRMYSIHSVTFPLHAIGRDLDLSNLTTSTIHFKDGIQLEEKVTVSKHRVEQTILKGTISSSSSGGIGYSSFVTEQDVVLMKVTFDELEELSIEINGVQVELPIQNPIPIPKDSLIKITYKAQIGLYPFDQSEILLTFIDENKAPVEIPILQFKNQTPTSEWIHQFVKERATK